MSIDPRLAERRRSVAEDNAKRNIGRLLRFLSLLAVVGALVWLALSPLLSVAQVRTAGVVSSDTHSTLVSEGVVAGTPMIMIRSGSVEDALERDPWVSQARVQLRWPDEVVVRVVERVPIIWVQSAEGWSWRAMDGVAVPGPNEPDSESPRLILDHLTTSEVEESPMVRGAAEFVDALPQELSRAMTLTVEEGELWTKAGGHDVRLGRPVEMAPKALSLSALLGEDQPPGATLILVAPTHPAVDLPDTPGDGDSSGEPGEESSEEP